MSNIASLSTSNSTSLFNKILIVDDEPEARELFGEIILRSFDVVIDYASNGKECVDKVNTNNYDLILLDVFMPGMDGFETLQHFKNLPESKPKIVIISNMGGDLVIKQLMGLGAHAYAAKADTDVNDLIEIVENVLYNTQVTNSSILVDIY
jgi:CheY-like chemotaxis protein